MGNHVGGWRPAHGLVRRHLPIAQGLAQRRRQRPGRRARRGYVPCNEGLGTLPHEGLRNVRKKATELDVVPVRKCIVDIIGAKPTKQEPTGLKFDGFNHAPNPCCPNDRDFGESRDRTEAIAGKTCRPAVMVRRIDNWVTPTKLSRAKSTLSRIIRVFGRQLLAHDVAMPGARGRIVQNADGLATFRSPCHLCPLKLGYLGHCGQGHDAPGSASCRKRQQSHPPPGRSGIRSERWRRAVTV